MNFTQILTSTTLGVLMKPLFFRVLPLEKTEAMKDIYRSDLCYISVGDQIETILAGRELSEAGFASGMSRQFFALLAMVTLFQYVEGYTDEQALEAVRTRTDWQYALHLPLSYPGFDPLWLCRFREVALGTEMVAGLIQALAEGSGVNGLSGSNSFNPSAVNIPNSLCQLNRLVQLTKAMLLAIEAMAAQELVWPRTMPLSHLYESYARTLRTVREVRDPEEAARLALTMEADIVYLLGTVDASGETDLKEMPEILALREIWDKQYERLDPGELSEQRLIWRPVDCLHCSVKPEGKPHT